MSRVLIKTLLCLSFWTVLTGCSAAGTNVVSLLGSIGLFKLDSYDVRISSLSELSSFTVSAQCSVLSTGFMTDITNPSTDTWDTLPTTYVTVNDQCASSGIAIFTFNLSSQAPYSTMALGQTYQIRIKDINAINMPTTETFNLTYSNYNLASHKRILGQGGNITLVSGSYSLKGRLVEISDSAATSGVYTLKGKVVFQ